MAQYFRVRKHIGLKRTVTFYEYIRAFAALRKRTLVAKDTNDRTIREDSYDRSNVRN